MLKLFLPNFSPLASKSKLWKEVEVTDRQTSNIVGGMGCSGGFSLHKTSLLKCYSNQSKKFLEAWRSYPKMIKKGTPGCDPPQPRKEDDGKHCLLQLPNPSFF